MRAAHRALRPVRDHYFRADVTGLERVPDEPVMLVGNHDGGYFPPDGVCLAMAWHERWGFRRNLFFLMHDFPFRIA
jgi:1-acyl-sn-glycerol-3-phosphate acyltransferase